MTVILVVASVHEMLISSVALTGVQWIFAIILSENIVVVIMVVGIIFDRRYIVVGVQVSV